MFPLAILLALNAVDEFDRLAFFTLAPEIRDHFGLSVQAFGLISGFTTVLVLLSGLPIGYAGDRFRRTRMVVMAAGLWALMSIGTGLAPTVFILAASRFGSGLGRVANESIHTSLLADYYPTHLHGRVFGLHRSGNPLGLVAGPFIAGTLAVVTGDFRYAFFIVAIPTFIVAAIATRLVDPVRGQADDFDLAAEAAKEKPVPFGRGFRTLMAVTSLKRFYISAFLGGGVIFALTAFLAQFFDAVFGVGELGRGLIGSGQGIAQLVGTFIGGIAADRLRKRSLGFMASFAGIAIIALGVGVLATGLAPTLPIAVGASWLTYLAIGLWTAPAIAVLAVVIPARLRSLGVGILTMFFGAGGFVFTIIAGAIAGSAPGMRGAISWLAPVLFVAAAAYLSAARWVHADGTAALQALAIEVELRHERLEAGQQAQLVVRDLDVAYDGVQVLFGVSIALNEGELVALLGTNGAGKSTLLRAISGLTHPRSGSVFFEGENVSFHEPHETAAAGIIQVPGGKGILPSLTVAESLDLAAWMYEDDQEHVQRARDEAFQLFPVLLRRINSKAGDLSGGEQQMLTLTQAMIAKPKLLMIDELSLGLAPIVVDRLVQAVRAINARGTTVIVVEQSVNIALSLAERAYFMEKGEIRFSGPTTDLIDRPDLLRSVFLEGSGGVVEVTSSREVGGNDLLDLSEISVSFGGLRALDDVNLRLTEGSIVGIIGPNGAGKTTLFDIISGFISPDVGKVRFGETDVTGMSADRRARMGLGRSFQDARLFPSLTVAENIALASERTVEVKDPVAAALGAPAVWLSEMDVRDRTDALIKELGLEHFRDKFVHELSTGTRRIVDIACSLAHGPRLLLLDEPSSGIAAAETRSLAPLLLRLRDVHGYTMLVIEHDIPLISAVADELIAMEAGRVISRGTPGKVRSDPAVLASYLGAPVEA